MPDTDTAEFITLQTALAGRYSLERELGRGGMGIVYLARDVALDRLVALKLLPPRLAAEPALRDRFLREARTAAKLSHPNIVPIFAVEEAGDFVFFVMAYVDGETLGQRVRTRGPMPPSELARVLREVAWGLAYAHAQGCQAIKRPPGIRSPPVHLVHQRGQDARPRAAQRVPECNRSTVHIGNCVLQA